MIKNRIINCDTIKMVIDMINNGESKKEKKLIKK